MRLWDELNIPREQCMDPVDEFIRSEELIFNKYRIQARLSLLTLQRTEQRSGNATETLTVLRAKHKDLLEEVCHSYMTQPSSAIILWRQR